MVRRSLSPQEGTGFPQGCLLSSELPPPSPFVFTRTVPMFAHTTLGLKLKKRKKKKRRREGRLSLIINPRERFPRTFLLRHAFTTAAAPGDNMAARGERRGRVGAGGEPARHCAARPASPRGAATRRQHLPRRLPLPRGAAVSARPGAASRQGLREDDGGAARRLQLGSALPPPPRRSNGGAAAPPAATRRPPARGAPGPHSPAPEPRDTQAAAAPTPAGRVGGRGSRFFRALLYPWGQSAGLHTASALKWCQSKGCALLAFWKTPHLSLTPFTTFWQLF